MSTIRKAYAKGTRRGVTIKRYFLFSGMISYAQGGWLDFHSDYDSLENAMDQGRKLMATHEDIWSHIYDNVGKFVIHVER